MESIVKGYAIFYMMWVSVFMLTTGEGSVCSIQAILVRSAAPLSRLLAKINRN